MTVTSKIPPAACIPEGQPSAGRARFLEGLTADERRAIITAATRRRFRRKFVVIEQDAPADRLYMVTSGHARHFFVMEDGHRILLLWRGPGDIFGGSSLLCERRRYLLGTETVTDCSALEWDRATIRALAARYPRLLENGLSIAVDYVTWHVATSVALRSHNARRRFADVVVTLARMAGRRMPRGIELHATNEELANAAHVSPYTASRLMSEWQRQGHLIKQRGAVVLRSPDEQLWRA